MHPRLAPNEEAFHLVVYAIAPELVGRKAIEAFTTKLTAAWPPGEGEFIQAHSHGDNPLSALPSHRLEAHFIRAINHGERWADNGWRKETTTILKVLKRRYPEVTWLVLGAASQPGEPGHEGKAFAEVFVNKVFRNDYPRRKHMWVQRDVISTQAPPHPTDFCVTVEAMEAYLGQELKQMCRHLLPELAAHFTAETVRFRRESLEEALEGAFEPVNSSPPRL